MIPLRDDIASRKFPAATIFLILANASVFAYQLSLPSQELQEFVTSAGAIPANFFPGPAGQVKQALPTGLTLLTSLFLHGSFMHIISNMLFLWIFGDNVEGSMGGARFILFYLFCGAIASLTHAWYSPGSPVPLIGASGAVSGVMGAYLLFFPKARVQTLVFIGIFFTTVKIPAIIFIGVWVFLQFANISRGQPHIAWLAHIGGFAAGLLAASIARGHGKQFKSY